MFATRAPARTAIATPSPVRGGVGGAREELTGAPAARPRTRARNVSPSAVRAPRSGRADAPGGLVARFFRVAVAVARDGRRHHQIARGVELVEGDVLVRPRALEQRALDLLASHVVGVHDPLLAVSPLARAVQVAALVPRELRAELRSFCTAAALAAHRLHRRGVARLSPATCVSSTCASTVSSSAMTALIPPCA